MFKRLKGLHMSRHGFRDLISNELPFIDWHVRFTVVPFKAMNIHGMNKITTILLGLRIISIGVL